MKYLALLIAIIATSISAYSGPKPAHYNNWIFGKNAGITFTTNDGNPEPLELMDDYSFYEGTPSISDDNGGLLYYLYLSSNSNIKRLINSGQDTILNSLSIESGLGPINPGLFIQDFTNPNVYYLITTPDLQPNKTNGGIYYNIIDRTKNDGKGEVILKNKNLYQNATEKMTAVVNGVDKICWVITHENGNNAFKIIRIDENGLDENIITQKIGAEHIIRANAGFTGRLSLSPSGTTLASTLPTTNSATDPLYNGDLELFDFDPKTGLLSNPRSLKLEENIVSTVFSPNGKLLYVKGQNRIYQYDLTLCDVDEMIENRYIIETKSSVNYNVIERGPNGIIYCGRYLNNYLDAILNPDIIGEGCNYTEDVIDIGGEFIWGLPTVINSYFTGEYDDYCFVHEEEEEERTYKVSAPTHACLGDEVVVMIKSNYDEDFEVIILKYEDYVINAGPFESNDSVATCSFLFERSNSIFRSYKLFAEIKTASNKRDTLEVLIKSENCCSTSLNNNYFNSYNVSNECYPVGYNTDMFFSADRNSPCEIRFKNYGELKSTTDANINADFFVKKPLFGRMLVGDPLPNVEQRAYYQSTATKIGTRYRFMASVCNVEKIPRFCQGPPDCKRSLNMWLGIKNRNQELSLGRIDDIKYDDDWVMLTGEFVAQDNYTELSVWVLGTSEFGNSSYGFGIDFVDLELVEISDLIVSADTTICIDDEYTPSNEFSGSMVKVEWTPTDGVSDPNILNPTFSPEVPTNYTITLNDELGCEYIDSIFVDVDSCLVKCVPCVSYELTDMIVQLGDEYCINGEFIPTCPDSSRKGDLSLFFEYNPNLMHFKSSSANASKLQVDNKNILKLEYSPNDYILDEPNSFQLCFTALLGGDSLTKLTVYEDINTIEEVCVTQKDSTQIKYEACILPYRNVKFISETSFDIEKNDNELSVLLSTEEEGTFRFVLIDINGSIVRDYSLTNNGNKYSNEVVVSWLLEDLAAGVYFVRMQAPGGAISSIKLVKP